MGDPEIKPEPESHPPLLVDEIESAPPTSSTQTPSPPVLSSVVTFTTPPSTVSAGSSISLQDWSTWRRCSHVDLSKQCEIKEQAVKDGLVFLRRLEMSLKSHAIEVRSSLKWLERAQAIISDKRECRVLIGFLGATGAGKSSLVNALLELNDLLPADDEKACTAVCVEILWNTSSNPEVAFRARIDRISHDDWQAELETLFNDISDKALDKDGENGEADLERDLRIKCAFQKLKCVYPQIKTQQDLATWTVPALLEHPNVKSILGNSKHISSSNVEEFSDLIKPYIDSSTSKGSGGECFAQWPLVKLVSLCVKSALLETGLVLVDLPGSQDTNAARGAIAESYQNNLSVTCVVAPTARAASDKPAQDLLGKVAQRTLQLDNRFCSEHLCFIVSKTDSSLNVGRYIRTHPNIEEDLTPVFDQQKKLNGIKEKVLRFCEEQRQSEGHSRKTLATINREMKNIRDTFEQGQKGAGSQQKRKRDAGDDATRTSTYAATVKRFKELQQDQKDATGLINLAGNKLYKAQTKIEEIDNAILSLHSRMRAACIRNRNEISTADLQADHDAALKQIGQLASHKPLQVFCVSAMVFFEFLKETTEESQTLGFHKPTDTGIPSLQNWLLEATLSTRDRNATLFLEALVSLELSMRPWIEDSSVEYKMEDAQRATVEDLFGNNFSSFTKDLTQLNIKITRKADDLVESNLFLAFVKVELAAAAECESVVRGWAQQPVAWSTHRATNKANGDWKSYKGVVYKWNDDLASLYLNPLIVKWSKTIHKQLPDLQTIYEAEISNIIESFAERTAISCEEICPDLKEALQQWKESIVRTMVHARKHSNSVFEGTIQDAAKNAHRMVKPEIVDCWLPVYRECGSESGIGHFRRNQETHIAHSRQTSRMMYKKCSRAIQSVFKKLWESLPVEFDQATKTASAQIKEEFEQLIENHTIKGDRQSSLRNESAAKFQLQQEVLSHLVSLQSDWKVEIDEPEVIIEEEPEIIDINVNVEDLFNDLDDIDEDILFNDSDGEDTV